MCVRGRPIVVLFHSFFRYFTLLSSTKRVHLTSFLASYLTPLLFSSLTSALTHTMSGLKPGEVNLGVSSPSTFSPCSQVKCHALGLTTCQTVILNTHTPC